MTALEIPIQSSTAVSLEPHSAIRPIFHIFRQELSGVYWCFELDGSRRYLRRVANLRSYRLQSSSTYRSANMIVSSVSAVRTHSKQKRMPRTTPWWSWTGSYSSTLTKIHQVVRIWCNNQKASGMQMRWQKNEQIKNRARNKQHEPRKIF